VTRIAVTSAEAARSPPKWDARMETKDHTLAMKAHTPAPADEYNRQAKDDERCPLTGG
jgi:hypothetical protein